MASGHPDWNPPVAGVGRLLQFTNTAGAASDIVNAPGAGFRVLLYWITVAEAGAASVSNVDETTPANVLVRNLAQLGATPNEAFAFPFDGIALAAGNKVRISAGGNKRVTVIYGVIPV